ncbi:polyketide synthase [Nonomuraea endophytica]|uniref:Phthiocerol/phenolphthiocerol synthesis type-I polyketide synthase D n=1 Tax=Nonomuraea endophytica TaxID=714136 RepID=A0A7W8EL39_9ACTN|nr:polyketide synthase [Nonomuraea endophytica]MBB5083246.1 phthiocerol/phenolphthiocerol synthesis type-I polyketide synthase D [Nonomuraea endophytica]
MDVRGFLLERLAARLAGEEVDPDRPLEEYGLSSRDAVAVAGELSELLGRDLSPTLVWASPTVNQLVRALSEPPSPERQVRAADEPVAVVGVGCRVPGAHGPEEFWRLLMDGRDAVGTVPGSRWAPFDDGSAGAGEALARTTRHGGFLADVAGFDAAFFGIAPGEAAVMDPQHRLLLETAWEALEHAGIAPRSLRGSRTGTFVGISGNEYAYLTTADPAKVDAWTATGAALSIAANRLSYLLDLRGPSLAVDTACSSSLVATHLAVRSLRAGESDLAVAAGVNLLLSPIITMAFDQGGGTSPTGRCRAFDASADGMVRAEGCGVVVLKRLPDALRDGDRVLAVITGTGVNQDGRSNGLVAPNPEAQESLLRQVHAGLPDPAYIEAHGTGTYLGDPIEAGAVAAAFPDGRVLLGSAKSNLGHLEAAAGVTGLIKTVLALHHGVIPPSIHFETPNPHIPWDRLSVVTEPIPWPRPRAGVSSFGFGGTNAHIALTAAPPATVLAPATAKHVFTISDIDADRVKAHAELLADWACQDRASRDVAHTLARRAGRGRVATAVVAATPAELAEGLRTVRPSALPPVRTGPVWVFSGYGGQWRDMGRHLYDTEPTYRAALDELAPLLKAEAGIDPWITPEGVAQAQPLIFATQLALARLWQAYGIRPAAVIGHSMGEVAAAVVAGGLSPHDAVRVICRRARLLGTLGGGGAMAIVEAAADEIPDTLHIAVHTSPRQTVITGDPDRVAEFAGKIAASGRLARTLTAEGAGHSPQVKPLLPLIREELAGIDPGKPALPYYSTVLDDPREVPVFEAAYWAAGVRRPVRLAQAVRAAAEDGFTVFTEISPHPLLTSALRDTLTGGGALVTHSLRREADEEFYAQVATVAAAVPPRTAGRVVDVPHAPWRHERHWVPPHRRAGTPADGVHRLLGAHVETPDGHAWSTTLDDLSGAPWRLDPGTWHRNGRPVLPVTVVARLAHAAAREVCGAVPVHDVVLHALLPLPARVTVTLSDGVVRVSAKDAAGIWKVYGTAALTPGPTAEGLESVRRVRADGTVEGVELRDVPQVPARLEDKLVERVWVESAPGKAGSGARSVVVVPRGLDPLGTQELILRIAREASPGERLTIVTRRAQAVLEGEKPDPGPASLRGLVRVLALERPESRAMLVDVDDLAALDRERLCDDAEDEVAWRDGTRYAARLRRMVLPAAPGHRGAEVVGPGAYVVTGGFGRLGLAVARWLAGRGATRIVLNGRSAPEGPLPDGAVVVVGDLAADGTAERLVEAATEGGLRLRGVVHAAGVLDDRLVADLDADSLHRVWTGKVLGGLRLHEATREADWWVAFSSAAALLGSPGQAAYAAANAWLDALCQVRPAAVAVNWGTWAGAAALPAVEALTLDEGLEALEALVGRGCSAGVVKLDAGAAVAAFPGVGRLPYFSEVVEGEADAGGDVSARVRGRVAAVLGVDPGRLDDGSVLTEAGLDSLAATRLRGLIEYDFGVVVPVAPLLNGGTLGELVAAVTGVPGRVIGPRDAAERQVVRVLAELMGYEPSVTDSVPPEVVPVALDVLGREVGSRVVTVGTPEARICDLADAIRAVEEIEAERALLRPLNHLARTRPNYPATRNTATDDEGAERLVPAMRGALFLGHPAGGTTGVYTLLAARLGLPVFGLERIDDPELGIPERAARYAEQIRRTGAGPYRLGGWSFGGILAFETGRLLGEDCEVVVMIDSGLPEVVPEEDRRLLHARRYADFAGYLGKTYGVRVRLDRDELASLDEQGQLDLAEARIAESGVLSMLSPAILRHQITSHEDTRAIERYRPEIHTGRVILYRSTEPTPWTVEDPRYLHHDDPARGFAPFSPGLEIVEVPGSHHLNLLDPPHVEFVAAHLEDLL